VGHVRAPEESRVADTFALVDVLARLQEEGQPYYEFLVKDSMSAGIYHLPAGEPDRQRPHTEAEIYYVLSGTGKFDAAGEITPVEPGSVIYVEKHVEHRFLDYPEGITVLVIFAPARGSQSG
jgi:mannose-6-phosphate isomerase-like protein (cupin superfamily)